jgi:hypothetical protein
MSAVNAERKRAPVRPDGTPRDLTVTALILGVAGALWFGWGQAQPPAGWGLPLSIETATIALGAVGLALAGRSAYTAPWILLVVGVHFVPLGRLFGSVDLLWAGLALSAVAIAGAVTGAVSAVAPSAVTGAFGGLVLVAAAVTSLWRALRRGQLGREPRARAEGEG